MTSGRSGLFLIVALLALLAGVLAASACGGDSDNKSTPVPVATSPAGTPKSTPAATTPAAEGVSVDIKNFAFNPKTVTIKVGQTVTWTNQDSVSHPLRGDGGIDSGDMPGGKSYSKTFDTEGTFDYECTVHPQMKGQVVVEK